MKFKHNYKWLEENGRRLSQEQSYIITQNWDNFVKFILQNFKISGKHIFTLETKVNKCFIKHLSFEAKPKYKDKTKQTIEFYLICIGIKFTNDWELADMLQSELKIKVESLKMVSNDILLDQIKSYIYKQIDSYFFPINIWSE